MASNVKRTCVIDIETERLEDPEIIHCIVCKDVSTKEKFRFHGPSLRSDFRKFALEVDRWIGHRIIKFDAYHINRLLGFTIPDDSVVDTLVLSRLADLKIQGGHSLAEWGTRLKFPKYEFNDFSKFTDTMLVYCEQDVDLTHKLHEFLVGILNLKDFKVASYLEHRMEFICRDMQLNGFKYDEAGANSIMEELSEELSKIDDSLHELYPPKQVGKKLIPFNPNSNTQMIDVLSDAGWKPSNKTKGHLEVDKKDLVKVERYKKYGWKIDEENLASLPDDAPDCVKSLVRRLILVTRIRKFEEWKKALGPDGRIHGTFESLGTWTHRFVHTNPNMANISAAKSIKYKSKALNELATDLGSRMRNLWICDKNSWLVGTDAEGIQLRVLAHYIGDERFIQAVTSGKKEDGTDPHTLNKKALGDVCKTRDNAKTFIYAWLLGAGIRKIMEILNCSRDEAINAVENFIKSYEGLAELKYRVAWEAARGYYTCFDGRIIKCDNEHLMMSGYLQSGEMAVMKLSNTLWRDALNDSQYKRISYRQVNMVHDEFVTEVRGSFEEAELVRKIQEDSIRCAGEKFHLKCPMKGDGKVGKTWLEVH